MAKAWVIKVTRKQHRDEEAAVEYYVAAHELSTDALMAVSQFVDDESAVLAKPLFDDEFKRLGLISGEVKRYA